MDKGQFGEADAAQEEEPAEYPPQQDGPQPMEMGGMSDLTRMMFTIRVRE